MPHVAVVYHSGFGHTAVLAKAVERGAKSVPGIETSLIFVDEIDQHWEKLDAADAIIFGSPTYMGSVSGPFKIFMDKSSSRWFGLKWQNKIASGFTNSGALDGDKLNTLVQMVIFAAQHGMIWVGSALLPKAKNNNGETLNRLGSSLGAAAQSNNESPEVTPPLSDILTAEHLGQRVAQVAIQFALGRNLASAIVN